MPNKTDCKNKQKNSWSEHGAFRRATEIKERLERASEKKKKAEIAMEAARLAFEKESHSLQVESALNRKIWDQYGRVCDYNNTCIDLLRYEAKFEHEEMIESFHLARIYDEGGDSAEVKTLTKKGQAHRKKRDQINKQIGELICELKEEREKAERLAPKPNSSKYHAAKKEFWKAKSKYDYSMKQYKKLKKAYKKAVMQCRDNT